MFLAVRARRAAAGALRARKGRRKRSRKAPARKPRSREKAKKGGGSSHSRGSTRSSGLAESLQGYRHMHLCREDLATEHGAF